MIQFAALLVALLTPSSGQRQAPVDKQGLPLPFGVESERAAKGDALAPYAFLKRREKGYDASEMWKSTFYEAIATYESFVGLDSQAIADYAKSQPGSTSGSKPKPETNPLEGFKPVSASEFLLKQAESRSCLMIGESHHMPQTRVIGIQLLKGLWDRGYRYLAAETFSTTASPDFDKDLNVRKYPLVTSGFYSREPVFGELVRTAQRLGYKLVPYEATKLIPPDPKNPNAAQQSREDQQAANLKEIFDKDPKAKVLVWNGYSHNYEIKLDDGLMLMGARFKESTGIDPYTVSQYTTSEREKPEAEFGPYRYAADHGLINGPTVFVDKDGNPFKQSEGNDCAVFLPRTDLSQGRPDWLQRDLGRALLTVPAELIKGKGMHLAQAFYEGEPANAVPLDQILIPEGSKEATLALPMNEKLWIRVLDEAGKESAHRPIQIHPTDGDTPEELAKITHPEIRQELKDRVAKDQAARFAIINASKRGAPEAEMKPLAEACERIDQENTAWLKSVIDKYGWPSKSMVGRSGAHDAWLLVQHADLDKPFQHRCLDLMKPLMKADEVSKSDFAYLTDRVLIGEGKKQIYGTQCTSGEDGHFKPLPVEDPKNLDKRRAEVGLMPMKDYLKLMEDMYGKSKKSGDG